MLDEPTSGPAAAEPESPPNSQLLAVLDELIDRFGGETYTGAITAARREYDQRRGRVFEEEALWEPWTQAFLEWYVVERTLGELPPAAQVLREAGAGRDASGDDGRDDLRRIALRSWLTSYRSLFEVKALRAGEVELIDRLGGGRFLVAERRALAGVAAGDVAELRLIGFEDRVVFGRTFCFHPRGTQSAILGIIQRLLGEGRSRRDIIDACASLRIRCERYRHVAPVRIYEAAARDGRSLRAGTGGEPPPDEPEGKPKAASKATPKAASKAAPNTTPNATIDATPKATTDKSEAKMATPKPTPSKPVP